MDEQRPPPLHSPGAYHPHSYAPPMASEPLQPRLHHLQTLSMDGLGVYADYSNDSHAMPPPQQRSRRRQPPGSEHVKHRRTRSGCYTCRQRRVKCDETRPICDRCRKGKRECAYPGGASTTTPASAKTSRNGNRTKESPGSSTASDSDDFDEREPLSAIPTESDYEALDDDLPESATSLERKLSRTSTWSASGETSASRSRSLARPRRVRNDSRQSVRSGMSQSSRWASLPEDVKYYLDYHRDNISYHHYAFKYDGDNFLKTTFLEIALKDKSNKSAALLYAILAFAAYHHSISRNDDNISAFLSYYNKSISYLQHSLAKRHSVTTLLTILQLATIEEFLGDWVNLLGHHKAAHQLLTDLFEPETIMQNETGRKIVHWYNRFDLFTGILSGGETTLGREWFAAAADFYKQRAREQPNDLGARFEEYFSRSRLLAKDITLFLASKTKNTIDDQVFAVGVRRLMAELAELGQTIETAFTDAGFVKSFPRAPPSSDRDICDYRDPEFLYAGELSTMNFVLTDLWGLELMFKYQLALVTGQPLSPELTQLALKKCKMFEAIQYGEESGPTAVLGCQASLAIMSIFLPKDERHTSWSRQKFADIERFGYIYPATLRARMSELWGIDVTGWWLIGDEEYPSTIRMVREFVEYRASRPTDKWTTGVLDMNGIFRNLDLEEHALSDEVKSAGTERSMSPWVPDSSPEQSWPAG